MDASHGSAKKSDMLKQVVLGLPLTYDEFKITRAAQIENLEIMRSYLRTNLTAYACERAKYNIV